MARAAKRLTVGQVERIAAIAQFVDVIGKQPRARPATAFAAMAGTGNDHPTPSEMVIALVMRIHLLWRQRD